MNVRLVIPLLAVSTFLVAAGCSGGDPGPADATPGVANTASPDTPPQASPSPSTESDWNPFGLMIGAPPLGDAGRAQLAASMGAASYRPQAVFVSDWGGTCAACEATHKAGLRLLLTVRNDGSSSSASAPPADLAAYRQTVGEILDVARPDWLVVENEENSDLFYTGTPAQYAGQLSAACAEAHERDIPCTNGGLVSGLVALLLMEQHMDDGGPGEACELARRAFAPAEAAQLCRASSTSELPAAVRIQLDRGHKLLESYAKSGQDAINFHWYIDDIELLGEAVAFLKTATGLPVISNEMGQHDESAETVTRRLQAVVDLGLKEAVWFSIDAPQARGLNNTDGSLRPNGEAWKAFVLGSTRR